MGDPPPEISLLSLACGWPLGVNGSLPAKWRRLQEFTVEDPLGARKGGLNQPPEWARLAGLGRPAQVHPSPVRSPIRSRGSSGGYAFCPLHLHYFDDVILASEPTPGVGQAGRPKPTGPVHPSPVRSPLHSRGSSGDYAFCPLHLHYFDDVILTSNMDLCMKSGLLCFNPQGYSFVALRSLPPLEVISSSL
jgi:hypothetical protein